MSKSNGFNNYGNDAIAVVLILLYIAELIFFKNVGAVKYILAVPVLYAAISLFTNKEIPIQAGRFWSDIILGLSVLVVIIFIFETNKDLIK